MDESLKDLIKKLQEVEGAKVEAQGVMPEESSYEVDPEVKYSKIKEYIRNMDTSVRPGEVRPSISAPEPFVPPQEPTPFLNAAKNIREDYSKANQRAIENAKNIFKIPGK
jgi:hypothetical protein